MFEDPLIVAVFVVALGLQALLWAYYETRASDVEAGALLVSMMPGVGLPLLALMVADRWAIRRQMREVPAGSYVPPPPDPGVISLAEWKTRCRSPENFMPTIKEGWSLPEKPSENAVATYYLDGNEVWLGWTDRTTGEPVEGAEDIDWPVEEDYLLANDLHILGFVDAEDYPE